MDKPEKTIQINYSEISDVELRTLCRTFVGIIKSKNGIQNEEKGGTLTC